MIRQWTEAAAEFEKNCREMYEQMARIAIVPRWMRFYDFGEGRTPRFLKDLAERSRGESAHGASATSLGVWSALSRLPGMPTPRMGRLMSGAGSR